MSQTVSYQDAVATLQSMFPQWEKEILEIMLQENSNHVERTIDAIFLMGGGGDSNTATGASMSEMDDDGSSRNPMFIQAGVASRQQEESKQDKVSHNGPLRGHKCNLPADFLKAPEGWEDSNESFGDQQLAMLLQNEMFQREVASTLGPDFLQRQGSQQSSTTPKIVTSENAKYKKGEYHAADVSNDMGIMKSLNTMGGAAKRNLNSLALQFSRRKQPDGSHHKLLEQDDTEFTHSPMRGDGNDVDDDDDEIIEFSNPGSMGSPSKSRGSMAVERGMLTQRGNSMVSAHDILSSLPPKGHAKDQD